MTAHLFYRDHVQALEAIARANGETDFADMLRCYRAAIAAEGRDSDDCRDNANQMGDECQRVIARFEQAADYLDELAGCDNAYARAGA